MTARAETWQAVQAAWRAIDSAVPAESVVASMEPGQLAPAWARALAIGYALGARAVSESDAVRLVDNPPAYTRKR